MAMSSRRKLRNSVKEVSHDQSMINTKPSSASNHKSGVKRKTNKSSANLLTSSKGNPQDLRKSCTNYKAMNHQKSSSYGSRI